MQAVDLAVFDVLGPGDVLFIDSTHVARTGGDVVHDVFEILPRLASGVRVHFHDIFYPFEYPASVGVRGSGVERAVPAPGVALGQHALPRRAVAIDARDPAHRSAGRRAPDWPCPTAAGACGSKYGDTPVTATTSATATDERRDLALPDGLVVVVKHECETCRMVVPVLRQLASSVGVTVYTQDDPEFPGDPAAIHDADLAISWHHDIETVPTVIKVDGGVEVGRDDRLVA